MISSTLCGSGGAGVRAEPAAGENEPAIVLDVPGDRPNLTITRVLTSFSATAATPLPENTHSDANFHAFPVARRRNAV